MGFGGAGFEGCLYGIGAKGLRLKVPPSLSEVLANYDPRLYQKTRNPNPYLIYKLEALNPISPNPKPSTLNPRPSTLNPKP